ncbi:Retrovirus-related Pol polyprotein from transposon opus, partial [Geodia barretti]
PLQERVKAIQEFPIPTSIRKLQPLNGLLTTPQGSDRKLNWDQATTAAFTAVKDVLATSTLLSHPKPFAPTCIMADASDRAVGAVLQQQIGGEWHPLSYFSKKLRPAETRYST